MENSQVVLSALLPETISGRAQSEIGMQAEDCLPKQPDGSTNEA